MGLSVVFFCAAFLLLSRLTQAETALPPSGFEIGERFPEIVLPSLEDGKPASIAQFRGQKVILQIFASW